MNLKTLIASDFAAVVDNLEPLTVKLNRNTPESILITDGHRDEMNRTLQSWGFVNVENDDVGFEFPAAEFNPIHNAAELRHLDQIVDGQGRTYVVQSANRSEEHTSELQSH